LLREIVKQPGEIQFVESRDARFSQEYQFSLRLFDPPMSMTLTAKEAEEILLPEFMEWASCKRQGKGERNSRYARMDFHPESIFFTLATLACLPLLKFNIGRILLKARLGVKRDYRARGGRGAINTYKCKFPRRRAFVSRAAIYYATAVARWSGIRLNPTCVI